MRIYLTDSVGYRSQEIAFSKPGVLFAVSDLVMLAQVRLV